MSPAGRHFILATAGHVDHGKSSLVKALTGTDPDRLPEEKARGITIELGFANLTLPDPEGGTEATPYSVGIVDVPGHEDFVKNMVAGVGSIDLALLVVAADDGWMPQTEEHLQILEYLGVTRGVIALTKSDLAADVTTVTSAVRAKLQGSPLADAPLVPTSVASQSGLEELRRALVTVLRVAPAPRDQGRPRLAVDRAFVLKGLGSIVTGTLAGGGLSVGQEVVVQPGGLLTRIRSIQSHSCQIDEARPGMRAALNLPDVALAVPGQSGVARGDVVTLPGVGRVSSAWQARLSCSPRLAGSGAAGVRPLKDGLRVQVHHGSACHPARLRWLESIDWKPGASGLVQLNFDSPVLAMAGDRFVVRDWPERMTLAGGLVLVPAADLKVRRDGGVVARLHQLAASVHDPERWLEAVLTADGIAHGPAIERDSPFGSGELRQASARLIGAGTVLPVGDYLVARDAWRDWLGTAQAVIRDFHRDQPEKPGISVADLRNRFKQLDAGVFQALLDALGRKGFRQDGALVRAGDHALKLPPELEGAGRRVRLLLKEKPLEPPSRKELAPDAAAQKVIRFLIDAGEAVDLGPELVLSTVAYRQAVELIVGHLRRAGTATVSELRPVLGTSRRILIPLLEHLDKARVTVRAGDQRRLVPKA